MLVGEIGDPAEGARLIGGDEVDRQYLEKVEKVASISLCDATSAGSEIDDIGGFQCP